MVLEKINEGNVKGSRVMLEVQKSLIETEVEGMREVPSEAGSSEHTGFNYQKLSE